jgi:hypothetical protein
MIYAAFTCLLNLLCPSITQHLLVAVVNAISLCCFLNSTRASCKKTCSSLQFYKSRECSFTSPHSTSCLEELFRSLLGNRDLFKYEQLPRERQGVVDTSIIYQRFQMRVVLRKQHHCQRRRKPTICLSHSHQSMKT